MARAKKRKHPVITDPGELNLIFRKLLANAQSIYLNAAQQKVRCPVVHEDTESLFVALRFEDRESYGIVPNMTLKMSLYNEGKELYSAVNILGAGKYEGRDALRIQFPKTLHINDDFGLTNLNLRPKPEITFTSTMNQLCTGVVVNIGTKGVDIKCTDGRSNKEVLALDRDTTLGFSLNSSLRLNEKGRVLYFTEFAEQLIGIEFVNINADTERQLAQWINDEIDKKRRSDQAFMSGGPQLKPPGDEFEPDPDRLVDDYPETEIKPGEDHILILSRDMNLINRLTKSLARKYGILISKGRLANVEKIIEKYNPKLVLIPEALGTVSGYDLVNTLQSRLDQELKFLMMGEKDEDGSRLEAAKEVGAQEYLVVEPFNMLAIFRKIDELMGLFI